jgi:hypothetical protein
MYSAAQRKVRVLDNVMEKLLRERCSDLDLTPMLHLLHGHS